MKGDIVIVETLAKGFVTTGIKFFQWFDKWHYGLDWNPTHFMVMINDKECDSAEPDKMAIVPLSLWQNANYRYKIYKCKELIGQDKRIDHALEVLSRNMGSKYNVWQFFSHVFLKFPFSIFNALMYKIFRWHGININSFGSVFPFGDQCTERVHRYFREALQEGDLKKAIIYYNENLINNIEILAIIEKKFPECFELVDSHGFSKEELEKT